MLWVHECRQAIINQAIKEPSPLRHHLSSQNLRLQRTQLLLRKWAESLHWRLHCLVRRVVPLLLLVAGANLRKHVRVVLEDLSELGDEVNKFVPYVMCEGHQHSRDRLNNVSQNNSLT